MANFGPVDSSGELSVSTQVTTRPGFYYGIEVLPPASGSATIRIYDTATGDTASKKMSEVTVAASQNSVYLAYSVPRQLNSGLYAQLVSGTTTFVVGYGLA